MVAFLIPLIALGIGAAVATISARRGGVFQDVITLWNDNYTPMSNPSNFVGITPQTYYSPSPSKTNIPLLIGGAVLAYYLLKK